MKSWQVEMRGDHWARAALIAVSSAIGLVLPAAAADFAAPEKTRAIAASPFFDWSGWYFGAHFETIRGASDWSAVPPGAPSLAGSFNLPFNFDFMGGTGSYSLGLQAGYNRVLKSRVLLGIEADVSAPNSDVANPFSVRGSQTVATPAVGQVTYDEAVAEYGSVRGRFGYAFDHFLLYGTGGFAWSYDRLTRTQLASSAVRGVDAGTVDPRQLWRLGWAAGIGLEIPVADKWTAAAEFLWTGFPTKATTFAAGAEGYQSSLSMESIRVGLNYHLEVDNPLPELITKGPSALATDQFAFHAQATYTNQYDPPFRAPYSGPNSLAANTGRETIDYTVFAGVKLWKGAELWINPEIDQGFGLSNTLGAAGFPSAEAYKVGSSYPYTRLQRAFVRQTIDLGGDEQKVDAGPNQFSGSQTSDRLVITVGKFGVVDVFDSNKYAHDPRSDFLNWSVVDTGTFDYAADAWAYTVGGAIEWYTGPWTFRGGIFDMSVAPNTTMLDSSFGQFQWDGEIERRYLVLGEPGKVAITGFLTRARMGSFEDAILLAAMTGGPPDLAAVRTYQSRGGISMSLEQQLIENVGFFARAGWADGTKEPYEFTDIDRTVAAGFSISGKLWGRAADTVGVAGVINGISGVHQAFLNEGGLGILVGDGQLPHPGNEGIFEAYYSLPWFASKVSFDYQLIVNPGYNRDRGPASVLGARIHWQY
jgi:high affinity Mn2+ porin